MTYGNDWENQHDEILERMMQFIRRLDDPQLKQDMFDIYCDVRDLKIDINIAIDTMAQMGSRHSLFPGDDMGLPEDDYQDWLERLEEEENEETNDEDD